MRYLAVLLALFITTAHAEAPRQARVYIGCAYNSELTFYIAQEKIYNHGSVDKLLAYAQRNLEPVLFELTKAQYTALGNWVDAHDFDTAKQYARSLFYECLEANYPQGYEPDESDRVYIWRFEQNLETVPEELMPSDMDRPEIEARLDMNRVLPWWMQ